MKFWAGNSDIKIKILLMDDEPVIITKIVWIVNRSLKRVRPDQTRVPKVIVPVARYRYTLPLLLLNLYDVI